MSSFISKEGVWHPMEEKVGLTNYGEPFKHPKTGEIVNTGDPYIYQGPCRAALFELFQIDKTGATTTLGTNFRKSPDFLQMLRDLNFTEQAYLDWIGYDEKKSEEDFKTKASVISKHELPKRVAEIKRLGGGNDTVGGRANKYGGFGDQGAALS